MVAVAVLLAAVFAFAQDTEVVKVKGRGVGADKAEALKDAYRDAVERAVGMYVDAEQMMKNEVLVSDQILTQSNAYIEKYDVAKETTKPNGLVEVQILAEVRKTALTKKISDVMPTKTFQLGGELKNAHAKMTTSERRNADGSALLENALHDFNPLPMMIDCSLASAEPTIKDGKSAEIVEASYLFKIELNHERYYSSVMPRLRDVLRQVSIVEPEKVKLSSIIGQNNWMIVQQWWKSNVMPHPLYLGGRGVNASWEHKDIRSKLDIMDLSITGNVSFKGNRLMLICGENKRRTVYEAEIYTLGKKAYEVIEKWFQTIERKKAVFNVSFMDKDAEVLSVASFEGPDAGDWLGKHPGSEDPNWICPLFCPYSNKYARDEEAKRKGITAIYSDQKFSIPKDVLPEIHSLKIELTNKR